MRIAPTDFHAGRPRPETNSPFNSQSRLWAREAEADARVEMDGAAHESGRPLSDKEMRNFTRGSLEALRAYQDWGNFFTSSQVQNYVAAQKSPFHENIHKNILDILFKGTGNNVSDGEPLSALKLNEAGNRIRTAYLESLNELPPSQPRHEGNESRVVQGIEHVYGRLGSQVSRRQLKDWVGVLEKIAARASDPELLERIDTLVRSMLGKVLSGRSTGEPHGTRSDDGPPSQAREPRAGALSREIDAQDAEPLGGPADKGIDLEALFAQQLFQQMARKGAAMGQPPAQKPPLPAAMLRAMDPSAVKAPGAVGEADQDPDAALLAMMRQQPQRAPVQPPAAPPAVQGSPWAFQPQPQSQPSPWPQGLAARNPFAPPPQQPQQQSRAQLPQPRVQQQMPSPHQMLPPQQMPSLQQMLPPFGIANGARQGPASASLGMLPNGGLGKPPQVAAQHSQQVFPSLPVYRFSPLPQSAASGTVPIADAKAAPLMLSPRPGTVAPVAVAPQAAANLAPHQQQMAPLLPKPQSPVLGSPALLVVPAVLPQQPTIDQSASPTSAGVATVLANQQPQLPSMPMPSLDASQPAPVPLPDPSLHLQAQPLLQPVPAQLLPPGTPMTPAALPMADGQPPAGMLGAPGMPAIQLPPAAVPALPAAGAGAGTSIVPNPVNPVVPQ